MSQEIQLLNAVTTTGAGSLYRSPSELKTRSSVVNLTGSGAISATVTIEVSNDGANWDTRQTFTLSGTNTASASDVDTNAAFKYTRANVTAISASAAVSLTMSLS